MKYIVYFGIKKIRNFLFLIAFLMLNVVSFVSKAQANKDPLYLYDGEEATKAVSVAETDASSSIPLTFQNVQANVIVDSVNSLLPFFEKLDALRTAPKAEKPIVRIVQIGDSHVRSHEFTPGLSARISEAYGSQAASTVIDGYRSSGVVEETGLPGVVCHCYGVDGATCRKFCGDEHIQKICDLKPDLIIISFGTNEAMGVYRAEFHYRMVEDLYFLLKEKCPDVAILYTTPPGGFIRKYSRAKKRRHRKLLSVEENKNIQYAAQTIKKFAVEHNVAYWDLFNIAGGDQFACKNWDANNYYKVDKIHFSSEGYRLQGNLLYEALIAKYNEYIKY